MRRISAAPQSRPWSARRDGIARSACQKGHHYRLRRREGKWFPAKRPPASPGTSRSRLGKLARTARALFTAALQSPVQDQGTGPQCWFWRPREPRLNSSASSVMSLFLCVSYVQASQDLSVHVSLLRDWVKKFADDPEHSFPGHGQMKPEQLEIARLKREVTKLKAERDILKKAAAYFAKEST
jgi:transposase